MISARSGSQTARASAISADHFGSEVFDRILVKKGHIFFENCLSFFTIHYILADYRFFPEVNRFFPEEDTYFLKTVSVFLQSIIF